MVNLGLNLSLILDSQMEEVNMPMEVTYTFTNIPILVATFLVNAMAIVTIRKKEKSGVYNLIVADCSINIITMAQNIFDQSPWFLVGWVPACSALLFTTMLLSAWNRLVSVAIVVIRYLLVCHTAP